MRNEARGPGGPDQGEALRPFSLVTADGAKFRVDHPEWCATGSGRTVVVFDPEDRLHVLDAAMITRLEVEPPAPAGRARDDEV